jgi:hypothetical protein
LTELSSSDGKGSVVQQVDHVPQDCSPEDRVSKSFLCDPRQVLNFSGHGFMFCKLELVIPLLEIAMGRWGARHRVHTGRQHMSVLHSGSTQPVRINWFQSVFQQREAFEQV